MVGLGEWVVGSVGWRWEGCERRVRREGPVEKKMVAVLMQGRLVRGAERGEGRWVSWVSLEKEMALVGNSFGKGKCVVVEHVWGWRG